MFDEPLHELESNAMFEKDRVFRGLPRSRLKSKPSEKPGRGIAHGGMNALAVFCFGDTVELRDKRTAQAASLSVSSDSQMSKLDFSVSGPYSNQSASHLPVFLSKQPKFLTLQAECLANIPW